MAGTVPRGTRVLLVRAGGRLVASRRLRGRRFDIRVALPRRELRVRVTATDSRGRRSSASVGPVFGLPQAARPRGTLAHVDEALAQRIVPLARAFPGTGAVYVRDLTTGAGAAWNARADFPAGSTLKLAVAVEVLRTLQGKPGRGSYADSLLRRAIQYSDNVASNLLEVMVGGSTSGGGHRVTALMRDLGLLDSDMYGGYIPGTFARRRPIPLRTDEQPYYGAGKRTSAFDLAQLFTYVHLAATGKGRLAKRHPGFTAADGRYLLYLLAHVADRGKLDRFLGGRGSSLHKAGWITGARHDAGLVYWGGGVFAVAVMTYGAGVGTASDVLAGRVARRALDRFSASHRSTATRRGNPIPLENAQAGTTSWRGPDVQDGAIEAYASATSVAPGETIRFHVSASPAQPYHIHVYRLGWYGGAGGREVACVPADCGETSDAVDHGTPASGWRGAGWPVTDTLTIPDDWVSGYYIARVELRAGPQDGRSTAVLFIVREKPDRGAQVLVHVPVNTWQAYNPWGGKSLYDVNSDGGRANRVSFERPLRLDYFQTWEWEIQLVRFLEREGYDVAYQTDVDTHRDPASLLRHRLVVIDGHDEYWTSATRTAFDAARDAGTNLAFVGANIGYWRISYEDGERTIAVDKAPTDLFRRQTPPAPECELLGVQYEDGQRASGDPPRDYRVAASDDAWLRTTGLSVLPELVGPEWDTRSCGQPGATTLFHYAGSPANADAVRYTSSVSGARVFSAGSLQFAWGLDDWAPPTRGFVYPAIPGLQQFMRNALDDLTRPAAPRVEAAAPARRRVTLRVAPTDPRVREVIVSRAGQVVCRTASGVCVDKGLRGHRTYSYLSVALDEWGRESASLFLNATVLNTPPALRLLRSGRSFRAIASDADGDRLAYSWRVDGRPWPAGRPAIRPPLADGRHAVQVTVTDGHGGRTTKRLRVDAS